MCVKQAMTDHSVYALAETIAEHGLVEFGFRETSDYWKGFELEIKAINSNWRGHQSHNNQSLLAAIANITRFPGMYLGS